MTVLTDIFPSDTGTPPVLTSRPCAAYKLLSAAERSTVDNYVLSMEVAAQRSVVPLADTIHQPISPAAVAASGGLLARPLVMVAIHERLTELIDAQEVSRERIIRELCKIAFSTIGDYVEMDTGHPVYRLENCTPDALASVQSFKHETNSVGMERIEIKLYDKLRALRDLCEITGLTDAEVIERYKRQTARKPVIDRTENAADAYTEWLSGE